MAFHNGQIHISCNIFPEAVVATSPLRAVNQSSIASSHTGRSQLKSIYLGLLSNQAASTNCPQELNLVFAGCFLNNIVFSLSFQDAGLFEDDAQFSCIISINYSFLKSGIPVYSLSVFMRQFFSFDGVSYVLPQQ